MAEDVAGRADDRLIKHERPTGENQHEQAETPTVRLSSEAEFLQRPACKTWNPTPCV